MTPRTQPIPTKAELEILQALWRRGPATVREIHAGFSRATGYTTVLKLLQIMMEKGLVERQARGRAHVYQALISEKQGMGDFMKELIGRYFGGSASRLALQALGTGQASRRELEEIRQLIKQLENNKP
jgi:predicted transcriptional regulator